MLDTLIETHQRMVISIAKKYHASTVKLDFEDLTSEGNIGLYRAIQTYDENKGSFPSYAYYWVRKYIQQAIEKHDNTIYIPRYVKKHLSVYYKIKNQLINTLCRIPEPDEVLELMEISEHEKICVKQALKAVAIEFNDEIHYKD